MSEDEITFQASLSATNEEVAEVAFDALTAAAWADYRSMLRLEMVRTAVIDSKAVPVDVRLGFAQDAFGMVLGRMSATSPFRLVLQRYLDDTVPLVLKRGMTPPRLVLTLIR